MREQVHSVRRGNVGEKRDWSYKKPRCGDYDAEDVEAGLDVGVLSTKIVAKSEGSHDDADEAAPDEDTVPEDWGKESAPYHL